MTRSLWLLLFALSNSCFANEIEGCGSKDESTLEPPKRALFYGDDSFIEKTLKRINLPEKLSEHPRNQRTMSVRSLAWYEARHDRDDAIALAWMTGAYTLRDIGEYFGLHYASISRIVRQKKGDV